MMLIRLLWYYLSLAALEVKLGKSSRQSHASIGTHLIFNPSGTADARLLPLFEDYFILKFKVVGGSGTLALLKVNEDTMSLGSYSKFNAALPKWSIDILRVTSTSVLLAFRDDDSKKHGMMAIATAAPSGDISMGEKFAFHKGGTDNIFVVQLSSGKLVFVFSDESNDGRSAAVAGFSQGEQVSTKSWKFGPKELFGVPDVKAVALLTLASTDKFIVVTQGPPDYYNGQGAVTVGTLTGSTVSFSPSVAFGSTYPRSIVACQLSSEMIVVAFKDADTWEGKARVGKVKSGLVEFGGVAVFSPDRSSNIRLVQHGSAESNQVLVSYSSRQGSAVRLGTFDRDRLVFSRETLFAGETGRIELLSLSAMKFVVAYEDVTPKCKQEVFASRGWIAIGSVDDDSSVSFGPGTLICDSIGEIALTRISETRYLVAYENRGKAGNGVLFLGKVGQNHGAGSGVVTCPEKDSRKHDEMTTVIIIAVGVGLLVITGTILGMSLSHYYKNRRGPVAPYAVAGPSPVTPDTGSHAMLDQPTQPRAPLPTPTVIGEVQRGSMERGVNVSCPKCRVVSNTAQWQSTYIESECPVCTNVLNLNVAPCGHGVCAQCMSVLSASANNRP